MTDAEWLHCDNPALMTVYLFQRPGPSDRKVRLHACAGCRQIWHLLTDERRRRAVEITESNADGAATAEELAEAYARARTAWNEARLRMQRMQPSKEKASAALEAEALHVPVWVAQPDAARRDRHWLAAILVQVCGALHSRLPGTDAERHAKRVRMRQSSCRLIREVFGNPFRPVAVAPAWLTPTIKALAQAAYDNRSLPSGRLDNARLAVLSDALEEVGCDNADILSHCRQPGEHVRGCWLIDALLGKS
jgi:hypothetical protein